MSLNDAKPLQGERYDEFCPITTKKEGGVKKLSNLCDVIYERCITVSKNITERQFGERRVQDRQGRRDQRVVVGLHLEPLRLRSLHGRSRIKGQRHPSRLAAAQLLRQAGLLPQPHRLRHQPP